MRVGWWSAAAAVLAFGLAPTATADAAAPPVEVRVLSGPQARSAITLRATPTAEIEDRTPGRQPVAERQGPASKGETFATELTLFVRDFVVPRPASIDVADPVVSTVRLFPEEHGTTVTVFVRQPVTYTVSRPSPSGDIRIELLARTREIKVTGTTITGRPMVSRPKPRPGDENEVSVDAESLTYDQQTSNLIAKGNVTVTRGDMTLLADEVIYDRINGALDARGHVVMRDPQATVEGESAHLNLEDESGWVDAANADLHPSGFTLQTNRLNKLGGPVYKMADGVFTSCRCGGLERPSWSIVSKDTDLQVSGAGLAHDATFRVKDVPVLYFPYLPFPANTDRQSGFLIPRISNSNRRGFQYEQPFFWAIDKSSDLTLGLDVETSARVGLITEYRYALSKLAHGDFTVAYFNEQIRGKPSGTVPPNGGPLEVPENRFALAGRHIQPFYGQSQLYLDLFAISDDTFLKEINTFAKDARDSLALRTTRFTESRIGVIKTWDRGLLSIENAYYQDLIDPQDVALERLPRIEAQHGISLLDDRVIGRVDAETVDYQREQGYRGLRGDLAPQLFLPFRLGRVLNGSLTGGLRETVYHLTDQQQVAFVVPNPGAPTPVNQFRVAPELPQLDQNRARELAEVQGRTGTEFDRVFDFPYLGLQKIKHTIEPELQYLFVPQVGPPLFQKQLPSCNSLPGSQRRPGDNCNATLFSEGFLFDDRDAINRRNFVSYGVTTRLLGRGPTATEVARASGTDASSVPEGSTEGEAAADFVGPRLPPPPRGASKTPPQSPPRELMRLSLLHGFDIARPLQSDSHQSDLDLGFRMAPLDYLTLAYDATLGLQHTEVRGQTIGVGVHEPGWVPVDPLHNFQNPSTIGIAYQFIQNSVNQGSNNLDSKLFSSQGLEQITGSVYLRLGNYIGFTFLSRYDLRTSTASDGSTTGPHFIDRGYLLRVVSRCNCWVLDFGVAETTNPHEVRPRIQFTLVGLGSVGQRPLRENYAGFAPLQGLGVLHPRFGGAY
jgi:LPS-assembly protein